MNPATRRSSTGVVPLFGAQRRSAVPDVGCGAQQVVPARIPAGRGPVRNRQVNACETGDLS